MKVLLQLGANPRERSQQGFTALRMARAQKSEKIVKHLEQSIHGSNSPAKKSRRPMADVTLHAAAANGNVETVHALSY